jgi:hypothetical protein
MAGCHCAQNMYKLPICASTSELRTRRLVPLHGPCPHLHLSTPCLRAGWVADAVNALAAVTGYCRKVVALWFPKWLTSDTVGSTAARTFDSGSQVMPP